MVLLSQSIVGFLDFALSCILVDIEDLVQVLLFKITSRRLKLIFGFEQERLEGVENISHLLKFNI